MTWYMGIDIGSSASKGVLFEEHRLVATCQTGSGINYAKAADNVRRALLEQAGITESDVTCTVSTGHGAQIIASSNRHAPDAACCAKGIHQLLPEVRSVIDVQAQSCQIILLDARGRLVDHMAGEPCASCSGSFIDTIANVLQVERAAVGPLSLKSQNPVVFSTACAVFGESEAVSRVAEGAAREDILAGVHRMLAAKIASMAGRIGLTAPCAISGGGALNIGLVQSLADAGLDLSVPDRPELINAIGAAAIARNHFKRAMPG